MANTSEKKYELTEKSKKIFCPELVQEKDREVTLYRIQAMKDFTLADGTKVKKGDLGGWIQRSRNLAQKGNCWVADEACVYGRARVKDDAIVRGHAEVYGSTSQQKRMTSVYGRAQVSEHTYIEGYVGEDACVSDHASVVGTACVGGSAVVSGKAEISGRGSVYGEAKVYDLATVRGNAQIFGCAEIFGNADVADACVVCGRAKVFEDAQISGITNAYDEVVNSDISGNVRVHGSAVVCASILSGDADVCGDAYLIRGVISSEGIEVYDDKPLYERSDKELDFGYLEDDSLYLSF